MQFFFGLVFAWSVIDGDTIRVSVNVWPNVAAVEERVRLLRIDTPEVHSKVACEKELAAKATAYTKARLTEAKRIEIMAQARDSFGRVLGEVMLDGKSLNDDLLAQGLARKYGSSGPWAGC